MSGTHFAERRQVAAAGATAHGVVGGAAENAHPLGNGVSGEMTSFGRPPPP